MNNIGHEITQNEYYDPSNRENCLYTENPAYSAEVNNGNTDTGSNHHNIEIPQAPHEKNRSKRIVYLFDMIGYITGLGAIIKLPSLVYKYGGGFFIPYTVSYFILGLPLFLLEVYVGQFTSRGCIECWGTCPLLRALGVGMVALTVAGTYTYTMFIIWASRYLCLTFIPILPWSSKNLSVDDPNLSSQVYFDNEGFKTIASTGIDNVGPLVWEIVLLSLGIWVLLLLAFLYGIRYRFKIIYLTVSIPYLLIFILLIHSFSLEGSTTGLSKFLSIRNLGNIQMWADAAVQIIYLLSIGEGGLISFSSFCNIKENLFVNSLIISSVNFLTSVVASIFSCAYFGYLDTKHFNFTILNQTSNLGVGFIAIPQVFSTVPNGNFFAFIYYLLLLVIGFDTVLGFVRIITLAIVELFSKDNYSIEKYVVIGVCLFGFLAELPLSTSGGLYLFHIFDTFNTSWTKLSTALIVVAFMVILNYGLTISKHIDFMISGNVVMRRFWKIAKWYFIILWHGPIQILLVVFLISKLINLIENPFTYYLNSKVYVYTTGSLIGGWIISFCVPFSIIVTIIIYFIKSDGRCKKRLRYLINEEKGQSPWFPISDTDRIRLKAFMDERT